MKYLNRYKVLLAGSQNGKIFFFDIEHNKCFCQIQAHRKDEENRDLCGVSYINEIDGNRIITCCQDSTMKLWKIIDKSNEKKGNIIDIKYLSVLRGHLDFVRKVIQLKNNKNSNNKIKLVSCSFDYCLGFWEETSTNNFELLKLIQSHNYWISEIHEIYDGRIFAIGCESGPSFVICNPNNYTFELVKDVIYCINHDCVVEINKDYYIIGASYNYLILFRLSGKMIVRLIFTSYKFINSLILLPDGNILADSGENMIKYVDLGNYEVKDAIKTDSYLNMNHYMLKLSNKIFISCDQKTIRIWEY